ncbi:hypothetical protein SAMN06265365_1761 [Tistlia consotensis]|uniref:Uncharacterized protein n=1 Tax=Tistlia consotensis USBA 355 TaxID=560819 RepID=A0A1Y6CXC3_9PROT|nr:hypothetical protein [Tistlia consotensis]SMF85739.1 hypothetical protein SAMN05428998_1702 [Tistlia consotensis USBA 355]SNS42101.1 hypothetical protein SAMN06265365_1761 [Tistlia consotensis]
MDGITESLAAGFGWKLCSHNVIVEGESDVALLWHAAALYYEEYRVPILGGDIAILAAGKGDDGGVDGVNRRLNAIRQAADFDRDRDGALRYRFIGLYDNDRAGQRGIDAACRFDRRLQKYKDLFLLRPIMPLSSGEGNLSLRERFELGNAPFDGLDWEVEDLVSERLLLDFLNKEPQAVTKTVEANGRKHREFSREGKYKLREFVVGKAVLEDVMGTIKLIRALRDYLGVRIDHIMV